MLTALLLLATLQTASAQPDRFGLPACNAPDQQLSQRTAFTICLSATHNIPLWAAYELTPAMLNASAPRQSFRHDPALSATNTDYRNSGYHRSHLVPASDVAANPEAVRDSYLLSNAVPQLPELNLSAWRKIENAIRRLAAHSEALYIITGTLFDCGGSVAHIGANQIAVPCATYKAVLALQGGAKITYAVILPNESAATRQTASIRDLESRTGLNLFPSLPIEEQNTIEPIPTPIP